MVPEVEDSVAVGLRVDGDVEVVLFVTLAPTAPAAAAERVGGREDENNVSEKPRWSPSRSPRQRLPMSCRGMPLERGGGKGVGV